MLTKEAIQELAQAEAISAAHVSVSKAVQIGDGLTALPDNFKIHDLEPKLATRRRARGKMVTSSVPAFAEYVNTHAEAGASIFVAQDAMTAVAVLNLGTPDAPGHADNTAVLAPKQTAAYTAMLKIATGAPLPQTTIAEFIEDWADRAECLTGESDNDEPRPKMAARHAAAAVRRVTIEAMQKLEATEGQLQASRSALESVKATSGDKPLPSFIEFTCEPYHGLKERTFTLRLGVQTGGQKPALVLRIAAKEKHDEEMADELATLVRQAFDAGTVPCLVGTYSPAS